MDRLGLSLGLCLFLAHPSTATPQAAPLTKLQRAEILRAITQYQQEQRLPAISVAIGVRGELALVRAQGLAQIENRVRATPATRFRSASTLKPLTATLILQLAVRHQLTLSADFHRYCPAFPDQRYSITIEQLLLHQGGVRGSDAADIFVRDHYSSVSQALGRFAGDSLRFPPGTGQLYSNYGYVLLACAIEGITGLPYDRALRESLLIPLAMTRTAPVDMYRVQANRASSYLLRTAENTKTWEGVWTSAHLAASPLDTAFPADPIDPSFAIGAGNYLSTPSDMVRFVLALDTGRLLPPAMRDLETIPQPAPPGTTSRPIGWAVSSYDSITVSQVFGSDWNGSFALVWDPTYHLAIAIASNLNWNQPRGLVQNILRILRRARHE
ncbi:MAG TPA: serine hydrolase domain-containing protein [Gemmatimonadales bacterium]|nr:serine hydrolase domain-containing protein [Gemmatimonadales bacterium]